MQDYNNIRWRVTVLLFIIALLETIGMAYYWLVELDGMQWLSEHIEFSWHYMDLFVPFAILFSIRFGKKIMDKVIMTDDWAFFDTTRHLLHTIIYSNVATTMCWLAYFELLDMTVSAFFNNMLQLLFLAIGYTFAINIMGYAFFIIPTVFVGWLFSKSLLRFRKKIYTEE